MTPDLWDRTLSVNIGGTFCPTKHAVDYWLGEGRGDRSYRRILNTSSPSGLHATPNQTHYGTSKAAVATFTVILARELAPLGIAVNALSPTALTEMNRDRQRYRERIEEVVRSEGWDPGSPDNVAAMVVWLGSPAAKSVTGRVFNIRGGFVSVAQNWDIGPAVTVHHPWTPQSLDIVMPELLASAAAPINVYGEIQAIDLVDGDPVEDIYRPNR
jgi:NAD(P)-dependent dehydrogenase (short-subunit alcohol dehydrogenase family)